MIGFSCGGSWNRFPERMILCAFLKKGCALVCTCVLDRGCGLFMGFTLYIVRERKERANGFEEKGQCRPIGMKEMRAIR